MYDMESCGKTHLKFVTIHSLLKIFKQIFKSVKKIEKIYMDSEQLINLNYDSFLIYWFS